MEGITIRQVTVTTKAAREILTTAFEAGIHGSPVWARVVKTTRRDGWLSRVEFEDCEENMKRHVVTDAEIKEAVRRVLCKPEGCDVHGKALGRILAGEFDGPLADEIVQVACFGKVIYG